MAEINHRAKLSILNLENEGLYQNRTFALDVLDGLSAHTKSIPSKYLYDEKGSKLFELIMEQPEYYPTKCELEILQKRKHDIKDLALDTPFRLVELGVGDARKTKVLLQHFLDNGLKFEYVLVDLCEEMIRQVADSLAKEYKDFPLSILGIVADYYAALSWLRGRNSIRNIVLFLGSSIGNFDLQQTQHFLNAMWNALNDSDCVFIGFDLKKDIGILQKAYNDSAGVTKEFNLNLLDRMNKELGADFDRRHFVHHSFYNPREGRMESWIVSTRAQHVAINKLEKIFEFEAWEGIHMENSYKYSLNHIEKLANTLGFALDHTLIDSKGYFVDAIWQVKKMKPVLIEAKNGR